MMKLPNEDWVELGKALEPLYRKARAVIEKAEMVSPQGWSFEVSGDEIMELKGAVNGIALLVGDEQV